MYLPNSKDCVQDNITLEINQPGKTSELLFCLSSFSFSFLFFLSFFFFLLPLFSIPSQMNANNLLISSGTLRHVEIE